MAFLAGAAAAGVAACYRDLIEPSPGATVRVLAMDQDPAPASRLYLDTVGVRLAASGVSVGPASFFDPLIVALHVKNRGRLEQAREVLNRFEEGGVIVFNSDKIKCDSSLVRQGVQVLPLPMAEICAEVVKEHGALQPIMQNTVAIGAICAW